MKTFHTSVLLREVIENLAVKKGAKYIDGTLGGGGHSFEILKRGGIVLGIDVDSDAIAYVREKWGTESKKLNINSENLVLEKGNFREIGRISHLKGFDKVQGVLLDLGVSGHQLETPDRGFSFLRAGPLDMRMDKSLGVKASDLINGLTKGELYELFNKLGEERDPRILHRIIDARRIGSIETTGQLVEIIEGDYKGVSKINRATKIFQALRIAVNDELNALKEALPESVKLLQKQGRIIIISFHSLEDRIVKRTFLEFEKEGLGKVITKKPVMATAEEMDRNRRSRSAKLRIFEKN